MTRAIVQGHGRRALGRVLLAGVSLVVIGGGGPTAASAQTVAITGGRVYPVAAPMIENGTVLIRDGRIVAVGANVQVPADAMRVDATGKWVTPGIVNGVTTLGIVEIGAVDETVDVTAHGRGDAVTASHRVWEGFNPRSPLIQVTRNDGITTIGLFPGGGLVAGQAAVLDLADGSMTDMLRRAPVAMVADIGTKGPDIGTSRGEIIDRLRSLLTDAREYARRRSDYEKNQARKMAARREDLEALQPVVNGTLPLVVQAERASDIEAALALAADLKVRVVLAGASEAWMVADKIAAAGVPVITGAMNNIPLSFAMAGARQDNAALLRKAGVNVVIAGNASSFFARNVKFEAGVAVSFGLPWAEALRAITLAPAQVFGVADRIGSLEAGKDANVVVWSGDPFEPLSRAERVYVRGREVQRPSRQDELMHRYLHLPPTYGKPPQ